MLEALQARISSIWRMGLFVGKAAEHPGKPRRSACRWRAFASKGLLGSKNVLALENIKAFGSHTITLTNLSGVQAAEGVNILNMPVVTIDGTVLGKIIDFAFDPANGQIEEYVLSGGLLKNQPVDKGVLRGEQISAIGRDVVIAKENIALDDLYPPEEDTYQSWQRSRTDG